MTAGTYCTAPYPVDPYVQPGTCRTCGYVGHVTKYGGMRPHLARNVGVSRQRDKKVSTCESPYDSKTIAEIVYDYAVVRGDLSEQYARDQLTGIIERRVSGAAALTEDPS